MTERIEVEQTVDSDGGVGVRSPLDVAEAYIAAYNAGDLPAMAALYRDDAVTQHHNRGYRKVGRDEIMAGKAAVGHVVPEKRLVDRRRIVAADDMVVVEHAWRGTAIGALPGFARAGEEINIEICTVMRIVDGQIASHDDYG